MTAAPAAAANLIADDPSASVANTAAITAAMALSARTGRPAVLPAGTFYARLAAPTAGCDLRGAGPDATRIVAPGTGDGPVWDSPWQSYCDHLGPMRPADMTLTITDQPPTPYRAGDYAYLSRGTTLYGGPDTGRADRWRFAVRGVAGDGHSLLLDRPLGPAAGARPEAKRLAGVEVRGYRSPHGGVAAGEWNLLWPTGVPAPSPGTAVYLTDGVGCLREFFGEFARVLRVQMIPQGTLCFLDRPWRRSYAAGLTAAVAGPHLERMRFADLAIVGAPTPETVPFYMKFCFDVRFDRCTFPAAAPGSLGPAPVASTGVHFHECSWEGPLRFNSATDCRLDLCRGGVVDAEEFCVGLVASGCRLESFGCGLAGPATACTVQSCDIAGQVGPFDDWTIADTRTRGTGGTWWHGERTTLRRSRIDGPLTWDGGAGLVEDSQFAALASGVSPYTGRPSSGVLRRARLPDGSAVPVPAGWVAAP